MSTPKFWMVLGSGDPTYRHQSPGSAAREAERLARLHPGSPFTVLESLGTVTVKAVDWDQHENKNSQDDDIPF